MDIESDWVAHWCGQLGTPVLYHRKLWETPLPYKRSLKMGICRKVLRGLGFGCGREPLPSYLAAHGIAVTLTDLETEEAKAAAWSQTAQHAASREQAFHSHLVSRERFDALVNLRAADINSIPANLADYDFCWSICALEHIGSIARGLDFLENSLTTLKLGGLPSTLRNSTSARLARLWTIGHRCFSSDNTLA